ncbi:MAG TPA: hypothetical protein P5232_02465 [Candidatus Moranbacteria bacterium]|nr:hypothetical protein [Candidatus Moranbacteria bacterium]
MTHFIIPVLFERNDSDYNYKGEVTLNVCKSIFVSPQDREVKFREDGVEFKLTIAGLVDTTVLCKRITLPYEHWEALKEYAINDFQRQRL